MIPHPVHLSALVVLDLVAVFRIVDQTFLLKTPYLRDSMFFFFVFIFSSSPALPFCTSSWNLFLSPLSLVNSGSVYFYMCILAGTAHPLVQLRPLLPSSGPLLQLSAGCRQLSVHTGISFFIYSLPSLCKVCIFLYVICLSY